MKTPEGPVALHPELQTPGQKASQAWAVSGVFGRQRKTCAACLAAVAPVQAAPRTCFRRAGCLCNEPKRSASGAHRRWIASRGALRPAGPRPAALASAARVPASPMLIHHAPARCADAQPTLHRVAQIPKAAGQLTKVLAGLRHTFVVADATLPDCPLVYASEGCGPDTAGTCWGGRRLPRPLACSPHAALSTCIPKFVAEAAGGNLVVFLTCQLCRLSLSRRWLPARLCAGCARASRGAAHVTPGFAAQVPADDGLLGGGGAGAQLVRGALLAAGELRGGSQRTKRAAGPVARPAVCSCAPGAVSACSGITVQC